MSARDAIKEQCREELQKNSSISKAVRDRLNSALCLRDCNNHGHCVNGAYEELKLKLFVLYVCHVGSDFYYDAYQPAEALFPSNAFFPDPLIRRVRRGLRLPGWLGRC